MSERSKGEVSRRRPSLPTKAPEREPWEDEPHRDDPEPVRRAPGVAPEGSRPHRKRDDDDDDDPREREGNH